MVRAHTYVRNWGSASDPAALKCDDGNVYVVKACHAAKPEISRMMIADQIVGRIGTLLGAPVPEVALVEVPPDLVAAQAQLALWTPGAAHGSKQVPDTTERAVLDHVNEPINRDRFARLAVLYGWAYGGDQQFIFEKSAPPRVYSHDHGHFFPGGPGWTVASLAQHDADLDAGLVGGCSLNRVEIAGAMARLDAVDPANLVDVVESVPAAWGITADERTALIEFLTKRRESLLKRHPVPNP